MGELRQREPRLEIPKLRALAKGQPCLVPVLPGFYVQFHDPRTVVWCHSNQQRHGKGKSTKAHDCFGFFGCAVCHHAIDQGRVLSRSQRVNATDEAMRRTREVLLFGGMVEFSEAIIYGDDDTWYRAWRDGIARVA